MLSKTLSLAKDSLAYSRVYGGLFTKPRTGWLNRDISAFPWAETVGGHSVKLEIAAGLYTSHKGQSPKTARNFARYHDLPERIAPDRTPKDPKYKDKHQEEKAALDTIVGWFSKRRGEWIHNTWHEYEKRDASEAITVNELDKVDPVIQAVVYRRKGQDHVGAFRDYAFKKIVDEKLKAIVDQVIKDEYEVNPYLQYFSLLHLNGDMDKFRETMKVLEKIPGTNLIGF